MTPSRYNEKGIVVQAHVRQQSRSSVEWCAGGDWEGFGRRALTRTARAALPELPGATLKVSSQLCAGRVWVC